MATPLASAPANPVVAFPFTGDYRVDTLLEGLQYRWNNGAPLGTPVAVSYSFMTSTPVYGGTDTGSDFGFSPFTPQQKDAARAIFAKIAAETGLRFTEVADSALSYGQIRLGDNTQSFSSGYTFLPNSTGNDLGGDVWLDRSVPSALFNVAPGTFAWATMVHEIGHALGLKHPGNYNAGSAGGNAPGNYLGVAEDNTAYTIVSYRDAPGGLQRDWYGSYDLLTLRTLYGAGTEGSGNSSYLYSDSAGTSMTTLYDAGGIDTLSLSVTTPTARVDLRPGAFSSIGKNGGTASSNNFSIDLATLIENFVGGNEDDTVTGNSANNSFALGLGTNTVEGGGGIDIGNYAGPRASYQLTTSLPTLRVVGANTSDTLTGVERLVFSDRKFAFDGNAEITARILGAVFGKAAVTNKEYAGIGLGLLDTGTSYIDLVQLALNSKLGLNASNDAVVNLLYTNLVGSAPGAGDLALYKSLISSGQLTQASLGVVAADHPLNLANINLVGLAATGLEYA